MNPGLKTLIRYWHTVRPLKQSQLRHRLRQRLLRKLGLHRRVPPVRRPAALQPAVLDRLRAYLQQEAEAAPPAPERLEALRAGHFTLLNHTEHWPDNPDWGGAGPSRLWRYQLHYFDFARTLAAANAAAPGAEDAALATRWTDSWLAANPPGADVAWDPDVVACRLINWACLFAVFGPPDARTTHSYAQQAGYLAAHLEWDVLGNHLLKNALGLVVAGALCDASLRDRGLRLLEACLDEQILPDGAHYERSPMYHAQLLADLLLLCALLDPLPAFVAKAAGRMRQFLDAVTHPDGEIALFGDAALGEATAPRALRDLARRVLNEDHRPPLGSFSLSRAGFHILSTRDNQARMILKGGLPGPDYQLGHAHCDALSYELSLGARRIIVDSGVHGYAGSPYREYCRATRAHNTVLINGEEQLECWDTFRVARRYTWRETDWREEDQGVCLHGGYTLPSGARHDRTVRFDQHAWSILDEISGTAPVEAVSFIHFHPDVQLNQNGAGWLAECGTLRLGIAPFGEPEAALMRGEESPMQGWYCPRFGEAWPACVLRLSARGSAPLRLGYTLQLHPELPLRAAPLPEAPR